LGVNGLTGLTNLVVHTDVAVVHHGTGSANHAAQDVGQLLSDLQTALGVGADTTAHGDNHVGANQVNGLLGGLDDLHQVHVDVFLGQLHVHLLQDGLSSGLLVVGLGLHHAGTHGGHLRTIVGAHDGGHQVAAKGGTGHLQVGVGLELGVVHVDGGGGLQEGLILLHIH